MSEILLFKTVSKPLFFLKKRELSNFRQCAHFLGRRMKISQKVAQNVPLNKESIKDPLFLGSFHSNEKGARFDLQDVQFDFKGVRPV